MTDFPWNPTSGQTGAGIIPYGYGTQPTQSSQDIAANIGQAAGFGRNYPAYQQDLNSSAFISNYQVPDFIKQGAQRAIPAGNDGGYSYTGGPTAAQQAASAAAAAQAAAKANTLYGLDQQERSANQGLGRLDPQQATGLQNIGNSYNHSYDRLGEQKGVAERDYNTGVQDNQRSTLNARTGIATNTANRMSALQRLLGMNGAGNSSAAYEQAPYLATREGTQQLQENQQTYAHNARGLDTNWQDTLRGYKNNVEDLDQQRFSQEQGLKQGIAQTRAKLLDSLSTIGVNRNLANGQGYAQADSARQAYQPQIDSLLGQITQLGNQYANPVLKTGDVHYAMPGLDQYELNKHASTPIVAPGLQGAANSTDPLLLPLLAQKRDQFGNILS